MLMLLIKNVCSAQTETTPIVEKSIYGVQTGLFGVWIYNESKLSSKSTLRTEIGLDGGYSYGSNDSPKSQYFMLPSLSLEPRWYYNFKNRIKDGKFIDNNSGNFLSLKSRFTPDLFVITNSNVKKYSSEFALIPSWGIRRYLGGNFDFETRLGLGYGFVFEKRNNSNGWLLDLSVRFGYSF